MYLDRVVGQKRIRKELSAIAKGVKSGVQQYANILFRGEAGGGKTLLANEFLYSMFKNNFIHQYPTRENGYSFMFPKRIANVRGHFVDEVHKVKNIEATYPIMDEHYYVMIFATNIGGNLPEAFTSRCFVFTLDEYTNDEIATILVNYGRTIKFSITKDTALLVAERSHQNPRIAKQYLDRMNFIINAGYYKKTLSGIKAAFKDIGVYEGGYTLADIEYLQTLARFGRASLDTMVRSLRVDKATVVNEIEPFLLSRGHIAITPRGRVFLDWKGVSNA